MNNGRDKGLTPQTLHALSGRFSADSVVYRGAQTVEVCGRGQGAAADLLFGGRIAYIDCLPDYVIFHTAAQIHGVAPVDEINAAVPAQETVDRTDVTVDIAPAVYCLKDLKGALHYIERQGKGHAAAEAVHVFFTGHAFEIFLDEIEGVVLLKGVKDAGNAGDAAEQLQHLRLPAHLHQASGKLFLAGKIGGVRHGLRLRTVRDIIGVDAQGGRKSVHVLGGKFLDGHLCPSGLIHSKIDRTEASGTQYAPDAVTVVKKNCILTHSGPPECDHKILHIHYTII